MDRRGIFKFEQTMADDSNRVVLQFGKYKGEQLGEAPQTYIRWLTGQEVEVVDGKPRLTDLFASDSSAGVGEDVSNAWTTGDIKLAMERYIAAPEAETDCYLRSLACSWLKQPSIRIAAKRMMNGFCWHCCTRLAPIGSARLNGADHEDWQGRLLHKKCFRELGHEME